MIGRAQRWARPLVLGALLVVAPGLGCGEDEPEHRPSDVEAALGPRSPAAAGDRFHVDDGEAAERAHGEPLRGDVAQGGGELHVDALIEQVSREAVGDGAVDGAGGHDHAGVRTCALPAFNDWWDG